MPVYLKYISAAVIFSIFCTCKNTGHTHTEQGKTVVLTVHLPFESCNYYEDLESDTNFILKDSRDKLCTANLDTITKGGGTVTYNRLIPGTYAYTVRTIFDETFTRSFQLTGDTSIGLSAGEIYGAVEAITLEELTAADSIKIILSDTLQTHTAVIRKENKNYSIRLIPGGTGKPVRTVFKDSASTLQAVVNLQVSLLGLKAMEINEGFDMPYEPVTSFYMKTGKAFVSCIDIQQCYFYAAHRKFITAIFQQQ